MVNFRSERYSDTSSGDPQILTIAIGQNPQELENYFKAGRLINKGVSLSNSIDNFMDNHSANVHVRTLGRLGIAKAIVKAENRSSLHYPKDNIYNDIGFERLQDTWLVSLFKSMQEGISKDQVESFFDDLSFVIFNYDRCVEHFFFRALQAHYGLDKAAAAEIVQKAVIKHPYGTIEDFLGSKQAALMWSNLGRIAFR